jgi:hypothetical protein
MYGIVEMASNDFSATRISGHQNILTDIALFKMNMVL